jgi:hypothetical protein
MVNGKWRPVTGINRLPVVLFAIYHSPFTIDHYPSCFSPFTIHHSPFTILHSPFNIDRSPVVLFAIYHLPFTIYYFISMFESLPSKESRAISLLKKAIFVFLAAFLLIGMVSAHRAYFQVRSLDLYADNILQSGSVIKSDVVSSGRTYADLEIELIQGQHAETLASQLVPANEFGFFDPRKQRASQSIVLTNEMLNRFQPGPARLRATAFGRSQWTRVPPPVVREIEVRIEK